MVPARGLPRYIQPSTKVSVFRFIRITQKTDMFDTSPLSVILCPDTLKPFTCLWLQGIREASAEEETATDWLLSPQNLSPLNSGKSSYC